MLLDPKDVAEAIKKLRGRRTQAEVAKQAGVSASQWNVYEGGKRLPTNDTLAKILKGLGCPEEALFDEVLKARDRRLGVDKRARAVGEAAQEAETGSSASEIQLLRTELRSLRAQLTMLSTYFVGLDRRIEQLLGDRLPS